MVEVNEKLLKSKKFVKEFNRILKEGDPMTLTASSIRNELEDLFKLERNSLKKQPWRGEINTMIDDYTAALDVQEEPQNSSHAPSSVDSKNKDQSEENDNVEENKDQSEGNDNVEENKEEEHDNKEENREQSDENDSNDQSDENKDQPDKKNDSDDTFEKAPEQPKRKKSVGYRSKRVIMDSSDEDTQDDRNSSDNKDESEPDTSPPPRKKQRQSNKQSEKKKQPAKNESGSKSKSTSADEETIKRLKGYIHKCGKPVIRQKELADCYTLKSQIRKLKSILEDLGVQGRPTIEKCEKVKAERELRAEIASLDRENILDSSSRGPSLRSRAASNRKKQYVVEEDDSDEEDAPKPLDVSFLGDQTDDSD